MTLGRGALVGLLLLVSIFVLTIVIMSSQPPIPPTCGGAMTMGPDGSLQCGPLPARPSPPPSTSDATTPPG